ncbi:MAG: hypothetical protein HY785_29395 [Oscillatoriophycideae cyanobacterium NC_groundwater_1537_Pr4_S-0.65um_50_18]|nr:hypothetical protein [Oscillatoriophycideae cyanobacterium NC_groundwater_1537_Pr4_S-0.65um_50_18]
MSLSERIDSVLKRIENEGKIEGIGRATPAFRVWSKISNHLKMMKMVGIEAEDKQLFDWAVQLAQASTVEEIDLSVNLETGDLVEMVGSVSDDLRAIEKAIGNIE